jgi:hypothetical protein
MSTQTNDNGSAWWVIGGSALLIISAIGSCADNASGPSSPPSASQPVNHYQDMRDRGHSEEDAVIYGILKQQGYSDYEAVRAMQSSKER